jgi:hypothetical protein
VTGAIAAHDKRCATCHPSAIVDHVTVHITALPAVSCQDVGCHPGTNLLDIHLGMHLALTCVDCHQSPNPIVTGAIAAHDKRCATCHPSQHAALHTSSGGSDFVSVGVQSDGDHNGEEGVYASCLECHASSLFTVHASNCALCHGSSASDVVKAAIKANDTSCVTCHPSHHYGQIGAHIAMVSQGCELGEGGCHNSNPYGGDTSVSCNGCHTP